MRAVTPVQKPRRRQDATSRASGLQQAASSRGVAATWNRLKPPIWEPLQAYGFPSKGETRLNDFKNQEVFYQQIVERYLTFCATSTATTHGNSYVKPIPLHNSRWATVPQPPSTCQNPESANKPPAPQGSEPTLSRRIALPAIRDVNSCSDAQIIHVAMRKLREGIVASRRRDNFAQRAEIFIIRAALLARSWESYHPALLHLLTNIHPYVALPSPELHEFVIYYILDLACRQNDLPTAYRMKLAYKVKDRHLDNVLKSLVEDNWVLFWKIQRLVDGYQEALLSHVEERMRLHSLQSLGKTYFTAEKSFIEKSANKTWEGLVKAGVGWTLGEDDVIVIRRPKAH